MNKLIDGVFNQQIEAAVSTYTGKPFKIIDNKKSPDEAMHDNIIFMGDTYHVFVKAGSNSFSLD